MKFRDAVRPPSIKIKPAEFILVHALNPDRTTDPLGDRICALKFLVSQSITFTMLGRPALPDDIKALMALVSAHNRAWHKTRSGNLS